MLLLKHTFLFLLLVLTVSTTSSDSFATAHPLEPTPDATCLDGMGDPDPNKVYVALLDQCVDFSDFGNTLLNVLIVVGMLAGGFRISLGFFLVITAQGQPTRLQEGREGITHALVGMMVVASAWIIVQFFEAFLPSDWLVDFTGGG